MLPLILPRNALIPRIIHTLPPLRTHQPQHTSTPFRRLNADTSAVGAVLLRVAIVARVVNAHLALGRARNVGEAAAGNGGDAGVVMEDLVGWAACGYGAFGGARGEGEGDSCGCGPGGQEGEEGGGFEEHRGFSFQWVLVYLFGGLGWRLYGRLSKLVTLGLRINGALNGDLLGG